MYEFRLKQYAYKKAPMYPGFNIRLGLFLFLLTSRKCNKILQREPLNLPAKIFQ